MVRKLKPLLYISQNHPVRHVRYTICIGVNGKAFTGSYIVISTAQTDLGLKSGTFSLKINKLPTFSEITPAWQCLKIVLHTVR